MSSATYDTTRLTTDLGAILKFSTDVTVITNVQSAKQGADSQTRQSGGRLANG